MKSQTAPAELQFQQFKACFLRNFNEDRVDSAKYYIDKMESLTQLSKQENFNYQVEFCKAQYFRLVDDYNNVIIHIKPAFSYFSKTKNLQLEVESSYLICDYFLSKGQYDSIIATCDKYIPLALKINNIKTYTSLMLFKGRACLNQGKNELSAKIFRQILGYSEQKKDTLNIFQSLLCLASVYQEINTGFALSYLNRAKTFSHLVGREARSGLYINFGNVYYNLGKQDSALYYFNLNLSLINKKINKLQYAGMIGNIANIYSEMGNSSKALEYQFESLKIFEEAGDSLNIEIAFGSIADIYLSTGKHTDALKYYEKASGIACRIHAIEEIIYNYKGIYTCYENIGKFKEAYQYYKLYVLFKDSLNNVEMAKKLTEQELNFKFENKIKEEALLQKNKDLITEAKISSQKTTIYFSLFGGGVLLIFLIITLRNSNTIKKINSQLKLSHSEIKEQKVIIETKNREITDSILYASRIQQGILPEQSDINLLLPHSYFFFRPRDIVSGDFYWLRKIKGSDKIGYNDLIAVVVADCTGHGVPGAFMSFIGSTIFNQTLENNLVQTPADALDFLNLQLPRTLSSKSNTGQIYDGMEAGICIFDKTRNVLYFSGANINLIHIRNGKANEIMGDKHSIGLNIEQRKKFTDHLIELQKNDCVYMFSDGYSDQFGGDKGKKFKYKNLITLLERISSLACTEQYKELSDNFDAWKGNYEQLDDVLVFGYKV